MQPRVLLGSTCALVLGLAGLAHADDDLSTSQRAAATTQAGEHAGMSRERILEMQRALIARNLYQGKADGVWGPKTEAAIRNFQTQMGLESSGELNQPTAQALGLDAGSAERVNVSGTDEAGAPAAAGTVAPRSQPAPEGASTNVKLDSLTEQQAREMQQRLQLLGYYRGPMDGKVGEGTRVALQRYFLRQAELARQGVISNAAIGIFGTDVTELPR